MTLVDLTNCDREPITRLERVQSFGFLLAMSNDWLVARASDNLEAFLGLQPQAVIGTAIDRWLSAQALHDIRNRMAFLHARQGVERLYGIELIAGLLRFDVAVHYSDALFVIEGEPSGMDDRMDAASLVRAMMARLGSKPTLELFHRDAARQIRAMTGFDRVMIYRFDEQGAGAVIAEAASSGMESYLGLHYPASDIPVQARALYLRNPFRIIADVDAATVPLQPALQSGVQSLDLSLAIGRAVSPIHIEYLRNMGVAASMSISIIVDGKLWGLIACHHRTRRLPSFVIRSAAELFGQMYSMTLESRLRLASQHIEERIGQLVERMVGAISGNATLLGNAEWLHEVFDEQIDCDGLAVLRREALGVSGSVPPRAAIEAIAQRLNAAPAQRVFMSDHLADLLPEAAVHSAAAAGLLAIPISRTPRDYILLFRREFAQTVQWAGNPAKSPPGTASDLPLSPRRSFAAFTQIVQGRSRPFAEQDRQAAQAIRSALIEVVLRFSEDAVDERQKASERQELLIAELNHRVRNILALIRGLVSQTGTTGGDVAGYVESLNGRIQALARAHDQITRQNWGPGRLSSMLHDEMLAYAPQAASNFILRGPEVFVSPLAFSTLSLVVHELVTNSTKYGALSTSGQVTVDLELQPAGGLQIRWTERGGPAVRAPSRRGFGSVVIERIVPFDLGGTAEVRYAPDGLEADFFIPAALLTPPDPSQADEQPAPPVPATAQRIVEEEAAMRPLEGRQVLLLEDNMIVALETEDLLRALGASAVFTAASIASATQMLQGEHLDFALLDINVGSHTSLDFALAVQEAGIPYVFASGYGEQASLSPQHLAPLTVTKPFGRAALSHVIGQRLKLSSTIL